MVGDAHGCFGALRRALLAIDFEDGKDRLFSVGDLIDRGPNSIEAVEWLEGGRFSAVVMGNHEAEMVNLMQTGNVLSPTKGYQQWTRGIPRQELHRWYHARTALPLAVTVETPTGQVGIVHCSTWRDSWSETLGALAQRNMGAIDMVLLGIDEHEKRAGPTGNEVEGIDRVFTGHDPHKQVERRANTWSIDTGAGFPTMKRLTLTRMDLDSPEFMTFETFARVPLLVIDDFGLKPLRAPQDEDFHDLVAERYEQGATIISSNLDFPEWGDAFPNRLLGAATLDRLRHGAYRLTLEGESYRSPRPMPEPRKPTIATGGKTTK